MGACCLDDDDGCCWDAAGAAGSEAESSEAIDWVAILEERGERVRVGWEGREEREGER